MAILPHGVPNAQETTLLCQMAGARPRRGAPIALTTISSPANARGDRWILDTPRRTGTVRLVSGSSNVPNNNSLTTVVSSSISSAFKEFPQLVVHFPRPMCSFPCTVFPPVLFHHSVTFQNSEFRTFLSVIAHFLPLFFFLYI